MRSPPSGDFDSRVAEFQRYLDELDRRTYSNFAVTNPTTGVKNLEVGPDPVTGEQAVRLRDDNGNTIYGNRTGGGVLGLRMPLPMYPSVPEANFFSNDATWLTTWTAIIFATSPTLQCSYRFGDSEQGGGTIEARVLYDTGSGPIVMSGSTASAVNPLNTLQNFAFTWPSNLFNTPVTLSLQVRVAVAGAFDAAAVASPMYVVGG